jgi:predicted methyltransferase
MHTSRSRLVNSLPVLLLLACGGATQEAPGASEPSPASATAPAAQPAAQRADDATAAINAILLGSHRSEENRARDKYRHPAETLAFFGVQPGQTVVELWPGRGWYTEVLAPLLRERGKLIAAAPTGNYLQPYKDFLATRPELYDRVQLVEVTPPDQLSLGPDGSADVVLTFRNLHGWVGNGYAAQVHAAVFKVLKPGGVFGVEDHRAPPGTTAEQTKKSGYTAEEVAIQLATAAGFVLDARSEINANPKDTKDYPDGVWTLPPSLRKGDVDRDKYLAIGESDRFTLRFRKPAP